MDAVFKALADPTRRAVIELLRKRDMTAGEIAENFHLSKPTLSKHFAVLREANLIYGEKSATTITYRLNLSVLEEAIWAAMNAFQIENDGKKLWKNKRKLT